MFNAASRATRRVARAVPRANATQTARAPSLLRSPVSKSNPFNDPAAYPVIAVCAFAVCMGTWFSFRTLTTQNDVIINKTKPFFYRTHGMKKGILLQNSWESPYQSQQDLEYDAGDMKWKLKKEH